MNKLIIVIIYILFAGRLSAQPVADRIQQAYQRFEADSQLRHAISSLYIIDASTGAVVFDKNSQIGLAPASTQKIITSVTAFELLGKDFQFKTYLGYDIGIKNGQLLGNLYFEGLGDPTLGSNRWQSTNQSAVLNKITGILKANGIKTIKGDIWFDDMKLGYQPVPDGWIWQDIGNYYGAGCRGLNWSENQYDLVLKPGAAKNDLTYVIATKPVLKNFNLRNLIRTGAAGSGDNGYIYYAPFSSNGFATGTIPMGEKSFSIAGAIPNPAKEFGSAVADELKKAGITYSNKQKFYTDSVFSPGGVRRATLLLDSISSPSLDSVCYWFLQKSINLYGEALIRQMALRSVYDGSTDKGVEVVRNFWKSKGLDEEELNMADGSGLSPLNRVTTHAQVEILKYAKTKDWYPYFYNALPEYNAMKMKSGTISDVKGFCGYHKAKDGKEYIFSFLVNNYNGRSAMLVSKMYKVLDELK